MRLRTLAAIVALAALPPAAGAADRLTVLAADTPGLVNEHDRANPGFFPEVIAELSQRSGVELPIEFVPWPRAQQIARDEPGHMIIPFTRSPEREPHYAWSLQVITQNLAFHSTGAAIDSMAQAVERRIAVVAGTPFEVQLRAAGVRNIEPVRDATTALRLVEAGRVDAYLGQDLATIYLWRRMGHPPERLIRGAPISQAEMYIGGHRAVPPALVARLQAALTALRADGTYQRIHDKYFAAGG